MNRRTFLQSGAGVSGLAALHIPFAKKAKKKKANKYNLYWGDLHCHCNISYARGSLEDALDAAEQQLDFCAAVGHSSWHDIPTDRKRLGALIDYHNNGFEKLARLWPRVIKLTKDKLKPGKFVPFLSFEWHSMKYGDHNIYYMEPKGEILKADSIEEMRDKIKNMNAFVIPHHIAYIRGYRGINWDAFVECPQSPFVEIYSRHGCSVTDTSPYPNLHDMGPRSNGGTIGEGLNRGFKFGFIASSDHHAGYPGSFGDGMVGVYAEELTPESLWEAFLARRTYGVTGDKIITDFHINDAFMGEEISESSERKIELSIEGNDFLDYVEIIKNGYILKRFEPSFRISIPKSDPIRAKVRIEWGWGNKNDFVEWTGNLKISDGRIISITPCFKGLQQTSPQDIGLPPIEKTLVSRMTEKSETGCAWHSFTIGNPNTSTATTCAVVLDVKMPGNAAIITKINGRKFEHSLLELLNGTKSYFMHGWLSEAVSFHRAVPEDGFILKANFNDFKPENPTDYYYIRARQKNNQWAWSSPIWINNK